MQFNTLYNLGNNAVCIGIFIGMKLMPDQEAHHSA